MSTQPPPFGDARDEIQMPPAKRAAERPCDKEDIIRLAAGPQ